MLSKTAIGNLVRLFDRGGYILDFSDASFDAFTASAVGIPIKAKYGLSKTRSLQEYLQDATETNATKLMLDLFEYYESKYQCEYLDEDELDDCLRPMRWRTDMKPLYLRCKEAVNREKTSGAALDASANFIKKEFSSESMNEQIDLLMKMRTEHPTDAIGKSKEILESCCKTILTNQGINIPDDWDAPKLSKETAKLLKVSISDIDAGGPEGKIVKQILGSLQGLATGVIEFRNAYGDGHGHDANFRPLPVRHAKLAVGSCLTLVEYYWETYEWRRENGQLK